MPTTLRPSGGDDTPLIQGAIDALPDCGGIIQLAAGRFRIGRTLHIGDGSDQRESRRHGVMIRGEGSGPGPLATHVPAPTTVEWTGGVDCMVAYHGPMTGGGLGDLQLDGAGTAGGFLDLAHVANMTFRDVVCTGYRQLGMHVRTVRSGMAYGSSGNRWDNFTITGPATREASGAWFTGGAPGLDTCSCVWSGGCVAYGGSPKSFGLKLEGADNNAFLRVNFQTYNAAAIVAEGSKIGPSLIFIPWDYDRSFPIENAFFACSFTVSPTGEGQYGNLFLPLCQGDVYQTGPLPENAGGILSMDGMFGRLMPRSNSVDPAEPTLRVTSTYGGHNGAGAVGFYRQGWFPAGPKDVLVGSVRADFFNGLTFQHQGVDLLQIKPDGLYFRGRRVKLEN